MDAETICPLHGNVTTFTLHTIALEKQMEAEHPGDGFPVRASHLVALVAPILPKTEATAIGVRLSGPWVGGSHVLIGEQQYAVRYCTSVLAIREALERHDLKESLPMLLLTSLSEDTLGWDVLVRLAKQRLLKMEPWSVVRDLFRARRVDPRVTPHAWMARTLLDLAPADGYPPVPGDVLDADTAWYHVLDRALGLQSKRPDADVLLAASLDSGFVQRYEALPAPVQRALATHLIETVGPLGELLMATLEAGQGRKLIPIGFACEVLFPTESEGSSDLERSAVRLEPFVGGRPIGPVLGRQWTDAARRVLERQPGFNFSTLFHQTEDLLRELRAEPFVGLSTVLPAGYDRRLERYGQAITAFLEDRADLQKVEEALLAVEHHRAAQLDQEKERLERLQMSLRLVRYLQSRRKNEAPALRTLSDAAMAYAREGSYVDWARTLLVGGARDSQLASALNDLSTKVRVAREQENLAFAKHFASWNEAPSIEPNVVPIERVLNDMVVPAARQAPVLLLVLDGMGFASFRQLQQQFRDHGWEEWTAQSDAHRTVALAVAPSITRLSRMSLFAGRLAEGTSRDEKRAFKQHPGLASVSATKKMPLLFHKGELTEGTTSGLAQPVREALGDGKQQVVGVVLNVLDDWLAKSDQVLPRWTLERIRLLEPLLYEARLARRLVILASDHGHVLEADGVALPGDSEERWRSHREPLAAEEMTLTGPRIEAALNTTRVIALWSECVRYVRKKAGYHGGVTPQEMLLPITVFAASEEELEGWTMQIEQPPDWWTAGVERGVPKPMKVLAKPTPLRQSANLAQPTLFGDYQPQAPIPKRDWIEALIASELYASQRKLAGGAAPKEEDVRPFLELLDQRDCFKRSILSSKLAVPQKRIPDLLGGLQRLLNIDGYPVLLVDEANDVIQLDLPLLLEQFQLDIA